jgi:hypothetical protein
MPRLYQVAFRPSPKMRPIAPKVKANHFLKSGVSADKSSPAWPPVPSFWNLSSPPCSNPANRSAMPMGSRVCWPACSTHDTTIAASLVVASPFTEHDFKIRDDLLSLFAYLKPPTPLVFRHLLRAVDGFRPLAQDMRRNLINPAFHSLSDDSYCLSFDFLIGP